MRRRSPHQEDDIGALTSKCPMSGAAGLVNYVHGLRGEYRIGSELFVEVAGGIYSTNFSSGTPEMAGPSAFTSGS